MKNAMRLERLGKLAEILGDLEHEVPKVTTFHMSEWFAVKECGTAACALGSAATHPWFTRRGLRIEGEGYKTEPVYREWGQYDAGEEFFGIDEVESLYLFDPYDYSQLNKNIKPKHVITRINALIAKYDSALPAIPQEDE